MNAARSKVLRLFVVTAIVMFERSACGQEWGGILEMKSRQHQAYKVCFAARLGQDRFQIRRIPSAKWPGRESFYLEVGETSSDSQIRIDGFQEKSAKNQLGIEVDASELTVTFLDSGEQHTLVRNVEVVIPTYYVELWIESDSPHTIYVKEGSKFSIDPFPKIDLILKEVKEASAIIQVLGDDGEVRQEVELEKGG